MPFANSLLLTSPAALWDNAEAGSDAVGAIGAGGARQAVRPPAGVRGTGGRGGPRRGARGDRPQWLGEVDPAAGDRRVAASEPGPGRRLAGRQSPCTGGAPRVARPGRAGPDPLSG